MDQRDLSWDQALKADMGKSMIHLVPYDAVEALARVLMYGLGKYGRKDAWREVEPVRYYDAAMRHLLAYNEDTRTGKPSVDTESGLPHLWHALTNVAFLVALTSKEEQYAKRLE